MFPTVESATSIASALQNSKIAPATNNSGKAFLKFDFKSGKFFLGQAGEDVTDEEIIINIMSIKHGWITWSEGKPTKVMTSFIQELPPQPAPIGANEPSEGREFEARFEDDPDTVVVFSSNSYGGRQGVDELQTAAIARSAGEARFLFPVVKLTSPAPYKHASGNTIHNPKFDIVDWMDAEGVRESSEAKLEAPKEEEAAEAPVRRRRRA